MRSFYKESNTQSRIKESKLFEKVLSPFLDKSNAHFLLIYYFSCASMSQCDELDLKGRYSRHINRRSF